MDEKVKAVKKSAEAPQSPLKFAKLTLLPSVGALGHAEFRSFRFRDLRDADFFKAGDLWIREVRRSSSLSAQLYTVASAPIRTLRSQLCFFLPIVLVFSFFAPSCCAEGVQSTPTNPGRRQMDTAGGPSTLGGFLHRQDSSPSTPPKPGYHSEIRLPGRPWTATATTRTAPAWRRAT